MWDGHSTLVAVGEGGEEEQGQVYTLDTQVLLQLSPGLELLVPQDLVLGEELLLGGRVLVAQQQEGEGGGG